MEDIYRIVDTVERTVLRSVMATIIHVEGSAYRKEGASMLFLEDGEQIGMLSGGCLEAALAVQVPDMLESGVPRSFAFDMSESDPLSWGEATGCGGVIHIAMEPVNERLASHLITLKNCLNERMEVVHLKRFSPDGAVIDYGFMTGDGRMFGEWSGELPQALSELASCRGTKRSGTKVVPSLKSDVFVHVYSPQPRLILFGAGPDARPLAALAALAGFTVIVCDWRPAYGDRRYFPDAETVMLGSPEETIGQLRFSASDYAVVMTHHFERDRRLVRLLAERHTGYVGILGSADRTGRLLQGGPVPNDVHSPVGLAISAEGPEEIAVSVIAEIIHLLRNKKKAEY